MPFTCQLITCVRVIAEGHLDASGVFTAETVLAKHDENYMPPEVADALRASGQWKGADEQ